MRIVRQCSCGKCEQITLDDNEWQQYSKWRAGEIYIQEIKTLNACEREFIKTGLCRECQKMIFNNGKSDRIKSARHNEIGVWA